MCAAAQIFNQQAQLCMAYAWCRSPGGFSDIFQPANSLAVLLALLGNQLGGVFQLNYGFIEVQHQLIKGGLQLFNVQVWRVGLAHGCAPPQAAIMGSISLWVTICRKFTWQAMMKFIRCLQAKFSSCSKNPSSFRSRRYWFGLHRHNSSCPARLASLVSCMASVNRLMSARCTSGARVFRSSQ